MLEDGHVTDIAGCSTQGQVAPLDVGPERRMVVRQTHRRDLPDGAAVVERHVPLTRSTSQLAADE